jgi:hypothetical protein
MARRYNRDSRGRFASGGGGGSRRPAPRGISRGTNRLTRDNSGRITSVGGDGATARGGRLRTASGKQRGTQTAQISGGRAAGTVTRSGARRTAVKPAKPQPSASAPKMTRAQYEAAAAKAWGRKPSSSTSKKKQSQDEQLDRLAELSGKRVQSRTGLSKSEAMKASDLGKATGRRVEVSQNAFGGYSVRVAGRAAATPTKPTTRAAAAAAKAKPAPKVDTSLKGVAARRARAQAPRTSTYLSQKLNTRSAITRSAANAIYNRQRAVSKQSSLDVSVVRNPIGIMPKTSGSIRNRAEQLREAARKRVVGGRRR